MFDGGVSFSLGRSVAQAQGISARPQSGRWSSASAAPWLAGTRVRGRGREAGPRDSDTSPSAVDDVAPPDAQPRAEQPPALPAAAPLVFPGRTPRPAASQSRPMPPAPGPVAAETPCLGALVRAASDPPAAGGASPRRAVRGGTGPLEGDLSPGKGQGGSVRHRGFFPGGRCTPRPAAQNPGRGNGLCQPRRRVFPSQGTTIAGYPHHRALPSLSTPITGYPMAGYPHQRPCPQDSHRFTALAWRGSYSQYSQLSRQELAASSIPSGSSALGQNLNPKKTNQLLRAA